MVISHALVLVGIASAITYFLFSYWKRRISYKDINRLHGPCALPLLGSLHLFWGCKNNAEYMDVFDSLMIKYPPPMKIHLGPYLFYATNDPEELEIILRHPAANQKLVQMYKFLEVPFGLGLITASGYTVHSNEKSDLDLVVQFLAVTCEMTQRYFIYLNVTHVLFYSQFVDITHRTLFLMHTGDMWKKNRRLIEPIFNQTLLNNFVPIIIKRSTELVKNFKERARKGSFNIQPFVIDCALGAIFEFVMGLNHKEVPLDCHSVISRCSEIGYRKLFRLDTQFDFIYKWTAMAKEEELLLRKARGVIDEEIRKRILTLNATSECEQNQSELKENVHHNTKKYIHLVDILLSNGNLPLEQIRSEIITFIAAGYDTSVFGLSVTLIMLGMFPEVQEKVYKEIVEVIPSDRNIENSDLSKLTYLDMVIRETLRLFPATPFIGRTLLDDIKLKTRTLPKGLNVLIPFMHIQRNEKFWPEPLKFIPERFTPEESSKRHPYSWMPFSAGPRNCIGMRFALMELKIVIAMTIRECVIKTNYNSIEEMRLTPNTVNTLTHGYNCSIELRK